MRVMIVGASTNPTKFGHKAVLAYQRQGHEVFPVNPHATEIAGLPVYPTIESVPGPIDRVSVYLPPIAGLTILEDLAARDDLGDLFFNPGSESVELITEAQALGLNPIMACSIVEIGERP